MKAFVWHPGSEWWTEQIHLENGSGTFHLSVFLYPQLGEKNTEKGNSAFLPTALCPSLPSNFKLIAASSGSLASRVVAKCCNWKRWDRSCLAGKVRSFCCLSHGPFPYLICNLPFYEAWEWKRWLACCSAEGHDLCSQHTVWFDFPFFQIETRVSLKSQEDPLKESDGEGETCPELCLKLRTLHRVRMDWGPKHKRHILLYIAVVHRHFITLQYDIKDN